MPFNAYLRQIRTKLKTGDAREGTHRSALEALLQSLAPGVLALNEPARVGDDAPDMLVQRDGLTIGWVETKDIGVNLDEAQKSDQLERYLAAQPNLILTDYLEFRWYTDGELRQTARIGVTSPGRKVASSRAGIEETRELLEHFLTHTAEPIGEAKVLAERMAGKAQYIRKLIGATFEQEEQSGQLHGQLEAFKQVLLPDLTPEQFADMYAQTIAYGLFAARYHTKKPGEFSREHAAWELPKTNPFLRRLFAEIAGPDLDERIAWAVDELAELLRHAQMDEIGEDFARRRGREDPVVHFYETFLAAYDPKLRKVRGVYYTPEPVVSYIVRSVDWLVREKFGRPDGLADPTVLILDPACGTGTFLYAVVELIYQRFLERNDRGMWPSYVREKLLPRVFGFEIMVAPYAIAHMKLGIQLQELGYDLSGEERLHIYLTNTLEEAAKKSEVLLGQYIAEEANAAAEIKRDKPIMVVIGNPPYSISSYNRGPWISDLIEAYKTTVRREETQIQPLSDDYVKFLRFAHWRIERTGHGVVGMITNNNYIDGIIFRDMRRALMESFSIIRVLDLHGNQRRRETTPDGKRDENVFDIKQGVGIALFALCPARPSDVAVFHNEAWGTAEQKYEFLTGREAATTDFVGIEPLAPDYLFVPLGEGGDEFNACHPVTYAFGSGDYAKDKTRRYGTGFKTQQDEFAICFSSEDVGRHVSDLLATGMTEAELRRRYRLCSTKQWDFQKARRALAQTDWQKDLVQCLYRPFDFRWTVLDRHVVTNPRKRIMSQLRKPNLALCIGHAGQAVAGTWDLVFLADKVQDQNLFRRGGNVAFPLYRYARAGGLEALEGRQPNLNRAFVDELTEELGLGWVPEGAGDVGETVGPEGVLHYIYALLHSPTYRDRYGACLKRKFPTIPLTASRELFTALAKRGAELVGLHIMADWAFEGKTGYPSYPVADGDEVAKRYPKYDEKQGRVRINKEQYFEGIEPEVWEFHIGGYQVLEKWLKDRRGRTLSNDDLEHYKRVVVALRETIRLMREIDECIPEWPIK